MVSKDELSEKLNRFRDAAFELKNAWLDSEYADSFEDNYPFHESFDDLYIEIQNWVTMCHAEMNPKHKKTFEDMIKSRTFLPADVYCDTEGINVEDIGLTMYDNVATYFQHYYIAIHEDTFKVVIGNSEYEDTNLFNLEKLLWNDFLMIEMNA